MPIQRRKFITRAMIRAEPEVTFVFGDNAQGHGFGGQAREMRGELNSFGIPTKWKPTMTADAFFTDIRPCFEMVFGCLRVLNTRLMQGQTIVFPTDGIGTGLARMSTTAPLLFYTLTETIRNWEHP